MCAAHEQILRRENNENIYGKSCYHRKKMVCSRRLASEVAKVLRGKNKAIFTPHIDTGDYVIVINASKVKVTGRKLDQKIYYHHSDYVGGMKETTLREMLAKKPEKVVELAVKGMLPKGPLGREMYTKLHVYAGPEHQHAAQKPEVLTF